MSLSLLLACMAWSQAIEGKVTARGSLTNLSGFVISVEEIGRAHV